MEGYGLFAREEIPKGKFIIDYVGEIIDDCEYTRRVKEYTNSGLKHTYFMNVGNGEYIDACQLVIHTLNDIFLKCKDKYLFIM